MSKRLLFIIGAGASHEAGLPTGNILKSRIASLLGIDYGGSKKIIGDARLIAALDHVGKEMLGGVQNAYGAARKIHYAMPLARSIDDFINQNRGKKEIEICAKLAIVRTILQAEQESNELKLETNNIYKKPDYRKLDGTWYRRFFQLITENARPETLASRFAKISVIIFNYDRCIEHFLWHALKDYYSLDDETMAELIAKIKIFHPYGQTGHLSWQQKEDVTHFGSDQSWEHLLKLASQIKTFSEGTDPESSEIRNIREAVRVADVFVFLGFSFEKLNMQLLFPTPLPQAATALPKYFGTAFGISDSDREDIIGQVSRLESLDSDDPQGEIPKKESWESRCKIVNLKCWQLFDEYSRSLSLS